MCPGSGYACRWSSPSLHPDPLRNAVESKFVLTGVDRNSSDVSFALGNPRQNQQPTLRVRTIKPVSGLDRDNSNVLHWTETDADAYYVFRVQ